MKIFVIVAISLLFSVMWCGDLAKTAASKTKKDWWLHFADLILDTGFITGWVYLARIAWRA